MYYIAPLPTTKIHAYNNTNFNSDFNKKKVKIRLDNIVMGDVNTYNIIFKTFSYNYAIYTLS